MSATGPETFDSTPQITPLWLTAIMETPGPDRPVPGMLSEPLRDPFREPAWNQDMGPAQMAKVYRRRVSG